MLVAPPRSGKGTIARVLEQLVGKPNYAGIGLGSLGQRFGLQPLIGKLVAVVADASLSTKSDKGSLVERILSISGEDTVQIDRKNLTDWEGRLPTRFFIHTNEVPNLADASGAFVNRFILLTTDASFLGREDHALGDKLMGELPGILLWAIAGWRRLQQRGRFIQPASGLELVDEFANVSSPIKPFVEEWCELRPDLRIEKEELYREFVRWSADQGRPTFLSKDQFCLKLYATFPQVKPGKGLRSEGRPPELRGISPAWKVTSQETWCFDRARFAVRPVRPFPNSSVQGGSKGLSSAGPL
jgi:putative DNA primase/helicase